MEVNYFFRKVEKVFVFQQGIRRKQSASTRTIFLICQKRWLLAISSYAEDPKDTLNKDDGQRIVEFLLGQSVRQQHGCLKAPSSHITG